MYFIIVWICILIISHILHFLTCPYFLIELCIKEFSFVSYGVDFFSLILKSTLYTIASNNSIYHSVNFNLMIVCYSRLRFYVGKFLDYFLYDFLYLFIYLFIYFGCSNFFLNLFMTALKTHIQKYKSN